MNWMESAPAARNFTTDFSLQPPRAFINFNTVLRA